MIDDQHIPENRLLNDILRGKDLPGKGGWMIPGLQLIFTSSTRYRYE